MTIARPFATGCVAGLATSQGLTPSDSLAERPGAGGLTQTWAIASISTRAPLGSCEIPMVERAGGLSPTCCA